MDRVWNAAYEANPPGSQDRSEGDNRIREVKVDIRQRMETDHYMAIAGTDADHGEHTKVMFHAPIDTPGNVANKAFLYGKDVGAKIELHFEDEDGDEIQITAGGKLNPVFGVIPSGTKMYFYQNTAPTGWTIDAACTDALLAVKGGAHAYNVEGGNPIGTWIQPEHTLTTAEMPAHVHTYTRYTSLMAGLAGGGQGWAFTDDVNTGSIGDGDAHRHGGNQYRPFALVGIIATKD